MQCDKTETGHKSKRTLGAVSEEFQNHLSNGSILRIELATGIMPGSLMIAVKGRTLICKSVINDFLE